MATRNVISTMRMQQVQVQLKRGKKFYNDGHYTTSLKLLTRLIDGHRGHLGEDHREILSALHWRALSLEKLGKVDEAILIFDHLVTRKIAIFGLEHAEGLKSMQDMAEVFQRNGRHDKALEILHDVIEKRKRVLESDHAATLRSLHCKAFSLTHTGHYEESLDILNYVIEKRKQVLGEKHTNTLQSLNNKAYTLSMMGHYEEALGLFMYVRDTKECLLGTNHPSTLTSVNNIAELLVKMGRFNEALDLFTKVIEKRKNVLGRNNSSTLSSMHYKAFILQKLGRYKEALVLYNIVIDKRKLLLGHEHEVTLNSMKNKADTLEHMGHHDEALKLYDYVIKCQIKVLGQNHPNTLTSMSSKAFTLSELRRYEEALNLVNEVIEARKIVLGAENAVTLRSTHFKIVTIKHLGNYHKALDLVITLIETQQRVLGSDHPDTLISKITKASLLRHLGLQTDALDLYTTLTDRVRKEFGSENDITLNVALHKASTLAALSRYTQALEIYNDVLEVQKRNLGENHIDTKKTKNNKIILEERMGYTDESQNSKVPKNQKSEKHPQALNKLAIEREHIGLDEEVQHQSNENLALQENLEKTETLKKFIIVQDTISDTDTSSDTIQNFGSQDTKKQKQVQPIDNLSNTTTLPEIKSDAQQISSEAQKTDTNKPKVTDISDQRDEVELKNLTEELPDLLKNVSPENQELVEENSVNTKILKGKKLHKNKKDRERSKTLKIESEGKTVVSKDKQQVPYIEVPDVQKHVANELVPEALSTNVIETTMQEEKVEEDICQSLIKEVPDIQERIANEKLPATMSSKDITEKVPENKEDSAILNTKKTVVGAEQMGHKDDPSKLEAHHLQEQHLQEQHIREDPIKTKDYKIMEAGDMSSQPPNKKADNFPTVSSVQSEHIKSKVEDILLTTTRKLYADVLIVKEAAHSLNTQEADLTTKQENKSESKTGTNNQLPKILDWNKVPVPEQIVIRDKTQTLVGNECPDVQESRKNLGHSETQSSSSDKLKLKNSGKDEGGTEIKKTYKEPSETKSEPSVNQDKNQQINICEEPESGKCVEDTETINIQKDTESVRIISTENNAESPDNLGGQKLEMGKSEKNSDRREDLSKTVKLEQDTRKNDTNQQPANNFAATEQNPGAITTPNPTGTVQENTTKRLYSQVLNKKN